MAKKIKNNTDSIKTWCSQEIQPGEYYEVQDVEKSRWAHDSTLIVSVANGDAIVNDGDVDVLEINNAINTLKENLPTITSSTIPENSTEMKPYGLGHEHFDSSANKIFDLTLTNKTGNYYTYSCSTIPESFDCIYTTNKNRMDEIEEVTVNNSTIETFEGRLSNGAHKLVKPYVLDFRFPDSIPTYKLWGMYADCADYGEDDHCCMQIVDLDNVLGYGAGAVLKEYDEKWARSIAKSRAMLGSPANDFGDILAGLYGRVLWYCSDITKTDVKLWLDYELTD